MSTKSPTVSISNSLITKENWAEYVRENTHCAGFHGYTKSTDDFINLLDGILQNADTFETLKSEIQSLKDERIKFVSYAKKHLP